MNTLKTVILMSALTALAVLLGSAMGGRAGAQIAFGIAMVMNFGSYWFSDRIVLATQRAQLVSEAEAPRLVATVRRLAQAAGLPMPRVAIVPSPLPNAFATGRGPDSAVVAVTEGLLRIASPDELEGVMAHELAHVKNRDILTGTIAAAMVGAITMLGDFVRWGAIFGGFSRDDDRDGGGLSALLLAIVAPFAAMLLQLAISRQREFEADRLGAQISQKPLALASALQKLDAIAHAHPVAASPATSHLFIVSPFGGAGGLWSLFRTHPLTEQRVARLQELAWGAR